MLTESWGATNERQSLAGFRLRTAAVARNAAWITLAGIAALTIPHHSFRELGTHNLVWALLVVAALGNLFTYTTAFGRLIQEARRGWPFYAWTLLLLLFDAAVVSLSHDAQHQVYLIYVPVLLFAVVTLEPWAHLPTLLLAVGTALGVVGASGDLSTDTVVASATTFTAVWLLGSYFAQEQRKEIIERTRQEEQALQRERDLARLHQHATSLASELQATVGKVIRAQEEERRRIARELHDEAVQSLSAAAVRIGDLEEHIPTRQRRLREALQASRDLLTDSLWEIRKIIVDLRPSGLDDLGLVPALRAYAQSHLEEAGVAVQMRARQPGQRLAPEVETAVFRIAQEAMNNVVRHASAHQAAITLEQRNGAIFLQVEDDGDGFDAEMVRAGGTAGGLGLRGMRERASLLGGTLELESRPGAGTKVRAIIPLNGGTNHEPNREP